VEDCARGAPGWYWQRSSAAFRLWCLLTAAQALVLQCVLVAMYQFVQLDRHLQAIGQLGCSETLLHILMDYGPSFKAGCSPVEPHTLDGACTRAAQERGLLLALPPSSPASARPPAPPTPTRACRISFRVARLVAHRCLVPSCWSFSCSSEAFSRMCYSTMASR
jgi:hypothetical protein